MCKLAKHDDNEEDGVSDKTARNTEINPYVEIGGEEPSEEEAYRDEEFLSEHEEEGPNGRDEE
ncbi:hypothetical protein KI387_040951, partial [Taxus chinensis]